MHEGAHAGDALFYLYAAAAMFERRLAAQPGVPHLVNEMREATNFLGDYIQVAAPTPAQLQPFIDALTSSIPAGTQQRSQNKGANSGSERILAANTLLDAMVSSGHFDWAEMVADIHERAKGEDAFITDRQIRAVIRIAESSRSEPGFWDDFEDEHTEAAKLLKAAADKAE